MVAFLPIFFAFVPDDDYDDDCLASYYANFELVAAIFDSAIVAGFAKIAAMLECRQRWLRWRVESAHLS